MIRATGEKKPTAWTTRDGRVIPFHRMTNRHLINSILMLRRNVQKIIHHRAHHRYENELRSLFSGLAMVNGDGARDALEGAISQCRLRKPMLDRVMAKLPLYRAMVAEAELRSEQLECVANAPAPAELISLVAGRETEDEFKGVPV